MSESMSALASFSTGLPRCLALSLLALLFLPVVNAQAGEQERIQARLLEQNAKLAGRALACGDRAGHASLRSASLPLLEKQSMGLADFDKDIRLSHGFSQRAADRHAACERNAEALERSLRRTQVIQLKAQRARLQAPDENLID